jgi:cytochrome c oxidase assembly protein subunit 15
MTGNTRTLRLLAAAAVCLALLVVVLGAYTRITNAGLGCPDWPGCFGKLAAPETITPEQEREFGRPFDRTKALTEMVHRYAAGTLGLVVLAIAVIAWRRRREPGHPFVLPLVLLGVVVFQALLGMWTVTWLLKPAVVTAHLLGGMTVLALLFWLALGPPGRGDARLAPWAAAGLVVLVVQIFLGGWTSANYAALACPEFPSCRAGEFWPDPDFHEAFVFWRGIGIDYEGGVLDLAARTAIQITHRAGALAVLLVAGIAAVRAALGRDGPSRVIGGALVAALLVQAGLGIANVLLALPVPLAVAHNATAALLLLLLTALLHRSLGNSAS